MTPVNSWAIIKHGHDILHFKTLLVRYIINQNANLSAVQYYKEVLHGCLDLHRRERHKYAHEPASAE